MSSRWLKFLKNGLILLLVVWVVLFIYHKIRHYQIAKQTDNHIKALYATNPDGADCLMRWYKKHPETRPENQKKGFSYLTPPCPGKL